MVARDHQEQTNRVPSLVGALLQPTIPLLLGAPRCRPHTACLLGKAGKRMDLLLADRSWQHTSMAFLLARALGLCKDGKLMSLLCWSTCQCHTFCKLWNSSQRYKCQPRSLNISLSLRRAKIAQVGMPFTRSGHCWKMCQVSTDCIQHSHVHQQLSQEDTSHRWLGPHYQQEFSVPVGMHAPRLARSTKLFHQAK